MLEDLKPHIADLRKRLINSAIALIITFFLHVSSSMSLS